jgi:ring-1,2-phenylacetyl-CoA epoxidase subunit PaaD
MPQKLISSEEVWAALEGVKDPEIPAVSVVQMGIVRDVVISGDQVMVKITPTFSGCPALHVIMDDIKESITGLGATDVSVDLVLFPPWSSDCISEEGRQQLKRFGLAPPPKHGGRLEVTFHDLAACPYCDATDTVVKNTFGPTLCRAIYYCNNCQQPFEQFKAL